MLNRSNITWSAKALRNQILKGKVFSDIAIQRSLVWDDYMKSLFIHSLIMDYPVPPMYFEERMDGQGYDVLDGKQRSDTATTFLGGEFKLCDNLEEIVDEDGNEFDISGLYFAELPEWAQDNISSRNLVIYNFKNLTDEQRDNLMFRLNNGKPFTAVELTRVKAKSLSRFQEMAKHDIVSLAVTEKGKKKYSDEQLCMQVWAACFVEDLSFATKDFRQIIINADVTDEQTDMIMKYFDSILEIYNTCDLDDKLEKKIAKRLTTRTHLVALMHTIKIAIDNGYDMEAFLKWAKSFFSGIKSASISAEYNATCGSGSARKDKVDLRFSTIVANMTNTVKG